MEPFSNPEASRRFAIAQKSFATFAGDVGGSYVPEQDFLEVCTDLDIIES
jgi:hypothetical protein